MSQPGRPTRGEVLCGALLVACLLVPLLIAGPSDIEEYQLGVFASQIHVQGLAAGRWVLWFDRLGFGTPMPIGHRLDLHPVFWLTAVTSLRVALSALWIVHAVLAAVFVWRFAHALGLRRGMRMFVLFGYLFSVATVCWFYRNDWVTFVVAWTLLPVLAWYLRAAVLEEARPFGRHAVRLGVLFGFVIVNSHPGYFGPLFVVLAVYALCLGAPRARVYGCFAVGLGLCVLVSSERLYYFYSEMRQFPANVARDNIQPGYSLGDYVEAAVAPFAPRVLARAIAERRPFTMYVDAYQGLRLPFVGALFGLAILGAIGGLRRGWGDRDSRSVTVACATALLLSLVPPELLLRAPSGSWLFRDAVIFFGLLAGGVVWQRAFEAGGPTRRRVGHIAMTVQIVQQLVVVFPGMYMTTRAGNVLQFYRNQGHPVGLGAVLQNASRSFGPRVYVSEYVQRIDRRDLARYGLYDLTDLTFLGVSPVNGWFKTVSMDRLYPSLALMHGYIIGEADVLANEALLDALSINLTVTSARHDQPPAGCEVIDRFPIEVQDAADDLVVCGNAGAWPRAVMMPVSVGELVTPKRPACSNDRALCGDFASFAAERLNGTVALTGADGHYQARVEPATEERVLFLSTLYREEWRALAGTRALRIVPVAGAFIGVVVPPGVTDLRLDFVPSARIALTVVSGCAWAVSLVACAVWAVRARRRGQPRPGAAHA